MPYIYKNGNIYGKSNANNIEYNNSISELPAVNTQDAIDVLAKDVSEISVGDVLRALEGSLEPVECAAQKAEEGCEAAGGCVTKYVWQKINESINKTVNEMDLKQLVDESKAVNNKADSSMMKCNN